MSKHYSSTIRGGQTFALVHLVELVMAILVICLLSLGVYGLLMKVNFFEQLYARDNAHLIEAFHAVPNGDVEFGYLWASKNYQLEIVPNEVSVSRMAGSDQQITRGTPSTKAFGGGEGTTITPVTIQPRYIRYTAIGNPDRTITASAQIAARGCPAEPAIASMQLASYQGFADSVGQDMAKKTLENAYTTKALTKGGLRLLIMYERQESPEIVIIDKLQSTESSRAACLIEKGATNQGIFPARGSLAAESPRLKTVESDVIVIVRGRPEDIETLQKTLDEGVASLGAKP